MAYDEEAHRQFLLRAAHRAVEEWLDRYVKERPDKSEPHLSEFDQVQCLSVGTDSRFQLLVLFLVAGPPASEQALVDFFMNVKPSGR